MSQGASHTPQRERDLLRHPGSSGEDVRRRTEPWDELTRTDQRRRYVANVTDDPERTATTAGHRWGPGAG